MTTITAKPYSTLWLSHEEYMLNLLKTFKPRTVCDIGGGRSPVFGLDVVRKLALNYTVLDISKTELDNTPQGYEIFLADVGAKDFQAKHSFDFVFSRMVAEHIKDGIQFHKNIYSILEPGGSAFHFFPTLYNVPFLINKFTPQVLSEKILNLVLPRKTEKFPAYYSWTYGPIRKQIEMLEGIGFEILLYAGGFGHQYYHKIPGLRQVNEWFARTLTESPNYKYCCFAYLLVRKPDPTGSRNVPQVPEIPEPDPAVVKQLLNSKE